MIYIFDIDGTLTPSRNVIDPVFRTFFQNFVNNNRVWLVTGSDRDKTVEQIGVDIWGTVERAYQCAGNQLFMKGDLIKQREFKLPYQYRSALELKLENSKYPVRAGNHIEQRFGATNFSIVGRDCTQEQRKDYLAWDNENRERASIVEELTERYPSIEIAIGGEISMDIYEKGKNKSQILDDIDDNYSFFGDHLAPGGNDYPVLARAIKDKKVEGNNYHHVKSWKDTYEILKQL